MELHLHLEGALTRAFLARLPGPVPGRRAFHDFDGFLAAFAAVCDRLGRPEHIEAAVRFVGARLRRQRVLHAEMFVSPPVHARRGLGYADLVGALERGEAAVRRRGGPTLLFIVDGVRQWGVGAFERLVRDAIDHPSRLVRAVGLGGDETALPAAAFSETVRYAARNGLRAVVHAGEFGPPAAVPDTVAALRPHRIGHGIRAALDPQALRRLRRSGVTLDVCLSSNRRTGALTGSRLHPLPGLVRAGVPVTLATDDPGLFGVTLAGEYARAARLGLTRVELARVARQAARSTLLTGMETRRLEDRLEAAWGNWAGRGRKRDRK